MKLDRLTQAIGRIHTLAQTRVGQGVNQILNWRNWFPTLQNKTPDLPWQDGAWSLRLFPTLSFSHLLELAWVEHPLKRGFYELEFIKSGWSVRELKRQRDKLLYERVGLSREPGRGDGAGPGEPAGGQPENDSVRSVCAGIHGYRTKGGVQRLGIIQKREK